VLWGRLSLDSQVYLGDLILTADSSSATLSIDDNYLNLNENTLIRIQRRVDGKGPVQIGLEEGHIEIDLDEGSLDLITAAQGSIPIINIGNSKVRAQAGTVLSVDARKDGGVEVQVVEGAAIVSAGTKQNAAAGSKVLGAGTMVSIASDGTEQAVPGVMVTRPRPNARYLKNRAEPFSVDFAWNRVNLEPEKALRLEIAADQNFYRVVPPIDNVFETAKVALAAGNWYWRLCLDTAVLASGQLTIAEATGPELISPPNETMIRYSDEKPLLRFQWSERKEALTYFLEIAGMPDFSNVSISKPVDGVFYVDSSLGPGTWYWRVLPVFPKTYEGSAAYSPVSVFHIEQESGIAAERVIEPPQPVIPAEPEYPQEPEPAAQAPAAVVPEVLLEVRLLTPTQGAQVAGLTALRNQTVFNWEYNGETTRSRFVLSRNANPLQGRPHIERINPGRTVRVNRLEAGDWYWTVEVTTPEGRIVRPDQARRLRVLSIPVLPAPQNLQPSNGYRIGAEELKTQRNIAFSWSAVRDANAYIVTLYQETNGKRQKITGTDRPVSRTSWTLDKLNVLDRGTFIWQVEAVNTAGGNIDQRGRPGESTFIIDIPRPEQVRTEEPSILE
jgi:hypothetical protein